MRKKLPAFSLLELLVVMGIAVILISLGALAMIQLRNSTLARQAVNELITNYNSVRNRARNGVLERTAASDARSVSQASANLDAYAIWFDNSANNYYTGPCAKTVVGANISYSCVRQRELKSTQHSSVTVRSATDNCNSVVFSLATGDVSFGRIMTGNNIAINNNLTSCQVVFQHQATPSSLSNALINENADITII